MGGGRGVASGRCGAGGGVLQVVGSGSDGGVLQVVGNGGGGGSVASGRWW